MAGSNLYMNWISVVWTPVSGTAVTFLEVTDVKVNRSGEMKRWHADGTIGAKAIAKRNIVRTITVEGGAINLFALIPDNTPGQLVAILGDFKNGAGSGALTLILSNCIVGENPFEGKNNEYGTGSLTFEGSMPDGSDPLAITVAS